MKKVIVGSLRVTASRVFIPVVEETALTEDAAGVFFAHLLSLVVVERENVWVYPFSKKMSLSDLLSLIPELQRAIDEARTFL
jgi:hypothetical protein